MALCEQCGSISVVKAQPESTDRVVSFFSKRRPFVCRRCGWRARRDWTDDDLRALLDYGVGGAEPDPGLADLDDKRDASGRRPARKRRKREPQRKSDTVEQFDLATLDLSAARPNQAAEAENAARGRVSSGEHRSVRHRTGRGQRQGILATIAATALVMFLVVLLGLTGSCPGAAGL